jgi:hypothetical protein
VLDTRASAHTISDQAELLIACYTVSISDKLGVERLVAVVRDQDLVEAHRVFKDELIERRFPIEPLQSEHVQLPGSSARDCQNLERDWPTGSCV